MPSSELSCCYAKYPPMASSHESLLLSMPNNCVQIVVILGKRFGKLAWFSPLSTAPATRAVSRAILCTFLTQFVRSLAHFIHTKLISMAHLIILWFYPFPTGPTNTTNKIKE
jgi:hypothetical protein